MSRLLDEKPEKVRRQFKGTCSVCRSTFFVEGVTENESIKFLVPIHQAVVSNDGVLTVSDNICKGSGTTVVLGENISPQEKKKREKRFAEEKQKLRQQLIEALRLEEIMPAKARLLIEKQDVAITSFHVRIRGRAKDLFQWQNRFESLGLDLMEELRKLVKEEIGPNFDARINETKEFNLAADEWVEIFRKERKS